MKFLLTIYLCAAVNGQCVQPILSEYKIDQYYDTHDKCVRNGLEGSLQLLFNEEFFDKKTINEYGLYPKFSCVRTEVLSEEPA